MATTLRTALWLVVGIGAAAGLTGALVSRDGSVADAAPHAPADPAWKASHRQTAIIQIGGKGAGGRPVNFCVYTNGNLLVCWSPKTADHKPVADADSRNAVMVFSPDGQRLHAWPLDYMPQAIAVRHGGGIFVGGEGRLARLDASGSVTASADLQSTPPPPADNKVGDLFESFGAARSLPAPESRHSAITGIGATDGDVFVASASPAGNGYTVYRLDPELRNCTSIVSRLSGCCGQMDIAAAGDKLWVAHNARHKVECYDREGKKLASFGKDDATAADGFGGCCEPKNIRITQAGEILTAESGPPVTVKRFTMDGKFLGVVAQPGFSPGCVRTTVDLSPDGRSVYLLNDDARAIHVFAAP